MWKFFLAKEVFETKTCSTPSVVSSFLILKKNSQRLLEPCLESPADTWSCRITPTT
jgi:hypothetical protein